MLTFTVTRSRVATALTQAAEDLERRSWDPETSTVLDAIDRAAGYVPGRGGGSAEEITIQAWEALAAHLDEQLVREWEETPGRTQAEVVATLRAAARNFSPGATR